jgi:uncharacterized protein (TIGR02646 family)
MKKVKKNQQQIPKPLSECDAKIEELLEEKNEHNFSSYYYASKDVKQKLSEIYNDKCAYCETDTSAGAALQVEHYRPKKKVIEDQKHEGYYWLAYEWTNLLYACSACNRAKSTHFPIKGKRSYEPPLQDESLNKAKCKSNCTDLINEEALILNPEEESFRAKEHFVILPNGKIKGKTERAEATIQKCKLHRKNLILARKKIIHEHFRAIMLDFKRYNSDEINLEQLEYGLQKEVEAIIGRVAKNQEYTLLAKDMLKHFDYFFTRRFQQKEQIVLRRVYQKIRAKLKK